MGSEVNDMEFSFKELMWKLYTLPLSTFHSSGLSHVATSSCKGYLEMYCLSAIIYNTLLKIIAFLPPSFFILSYSSDPCNTETLVYFS